jgi:hypothetical protein
MPSTTLAALPLEVLAELLRECAVDDKRAARLGARFLLQPGSAAVSSLQPGGDGTLPPEAWQRFPAAAGLVASEKGRWQRAEHLAASLLQALQDAPAGGRLARLLVHLPGGAALLHPLAQALPALPSCSSLIKLVIGRGAVRAADARALMAGLPLLQHLELAEVEADGMLERLWRPEPRRGLQHLALGTSFNFKESFLDLSGLAAAAASLTHLRLGRPLLFSSSGLAALSSLRSLYLDGAGGARAHMRSNLTSSEGALNGMVAAWGQVQAAQVQALLAQWQDYKRQLAAKYPGPSEPLLPQLAGLPQLRQLHVSSAIWCPFELVRDEERLPDRGAKAIAQLLDSLPALEDVALPGKDFIAGLASSSLTSLCCARVVLPGAEGTLAALMPELQELQLAGRQGWVDSLCQFPGLSRLRKLAIDRVLELHQPLPVLAVGSAPWQVLASLPSLQELSVPHLAVGPDGADAAAAAAAGGLACSTSLTGLSVTVSLEGAEQQGAAGWHHSLLVAALPRLERLEVEASAAPPLLPVIQMLQGHPSLQHIRLGRPEMSWARNEALLDWPDTQLLAGISELRSFYLFMPKGPSQGAAEKLLQDLASCARLQHLSLGCEMHCAPFPISTLATGLRSRSLVVLELHGRGTRMDPASAGLLLNGLPGLRCATMRLSWPGLEQLNGQLAACADADARREAAQQAVQQLQEQLKEARGVDCSACKVGPQLQLVGERRESLRSFQVQVQSGDVLLDLWCDAVSA